MKVWPRRLGYISIMITIVVVMVLTYSTWENFRYLQQLKVKDIPLIQDTGIIVRHDEILTSSLHLAGSTSDKHWIEKYENHKFVLIDSISQFAGLLSGLPGAEVKKLQRKNAFNIEDKILALLKANKLAEANRILKSPDYENAVNAFRETIYSHSTNILEAQEKVLDNRWRISFLFTVTAVISLVLIVVSWTTVLTTVKQNQKKISIQEKEIKEQEQKAVNASKLAALGEMAGGVAHEINNPLAIIHGYADMLSIRSREEQLSMEVVNEMATLIKDTSERIAKIIKGLRYLARDGSKDPFEDVLLQKVIEDTFHLVGEKFKKNNVLLNVDFGSMQNLRLSCRQVQFSQIVVNMINNAFDAVKGLDEKWVKIWAEDYGDLFALNIEDSGSGIPPHIEEKIFQPFFTTKDVGHGTGLGLSISASIVKEHNGTLKIDHKAPNTRFVILLPKAIEEIESGVA